MREGFQELGYQVETIWGNTAERNRRFRTVQRQIESGIDYEFAYSETSTMPTLLTERDDLPTNPFVDYAFLRVCHGNRIPLGLFYRDVYWQFDLYRRKLAWYKRLVTIPLYHLDLYAYGRWVDTLFLPSMQMLKHVQHWPQKKAVHELSPGGVLSNLGSEAPGNQGLRLFYVGATSPPLYDIGNLLEGVYKAVQADTQIRLTICCPEADWHQRPQRYNNWLGNWVKVVHLSGEETQKLYSQQDVAVAYRVPSPYLEFAMPVKVFEALGHGKPILTMDGTVVSDFVRANQCGWSVAPDPSDLSRLLQRLSNDPEKVKEKARISRNLRHKHTWAKRAELVASLLSTQGAANRKRDRD
jgi:glycosyltransferase involved in cell wall biosynthesis